MKTIIGILAICILAFSAPAFAEGVYYGKPIQYQSSVMTTSSVTSFNTPSGDAKAAIIVFEGSTARWSCHDTAPTADLGAPVYDGDTIYLDTVSAISKFKWIMKTGGTGTTANRTVFGN
jgi:hypothetical protein